MTGTFLCISACRIPLNCSAIHILSVHLRHWVCWSFYNCPPLSIPQLVYVWICFHKPSHLRDPLYLSIFAPLFCMVAIAVCTLAFDSIVVDLDLPSRDRQKQRIKKLTLIDALMCPKISPWKNSKNSKFANFVTFLAKIIKLKT